MDALAIAKIEELARPQIHAVDGEEYLISGNGAYSQIRPELDHATGLDLYSLDALVQMIQTEAAKKYSAPIYIMAKGHDEVACFLSPDKELRHMRLTLYNVCAKDVPGWGETSDFGFTDALIAIRTRFQPSTDAEYLLRLLSEISCGAKVTFADNGIATTVVQTKGVALQDSVPIKPIVSLRPYRTFQELEQPESQFHIRISEHGIRFIEADGGMWKLTARKTIAEYLSERLANELADGVVVIML